MNENEIQQPADRRPVSEQIRCPQCRHILGGSQEGIITVSIAVRGRKRRTVVIFGGQAGFRCEECGNVFMFKCQSIDLKGQQQEDGDRSPVPHETAVSAPLKL